jgi:hypothetical protein
MGDGAKFIFGSLRYNVSLHTLILSHNQILDAGAFAVANFLTWGSSLQMQFSM